MLARYRKWLITLAGVVATAGGAIHGAPSWWYVVVAVATSITVRQVPNAATTP